MTDDQAQSFREKLLPIICEAADDTSEPKYDRNPLRPMLRQLLTYIHYLQSRQPLIRVLQSEVYSWARRNFGPELELGYQALLGAVEEMGELSHSHLKQLQGIRGTKEEHEAAGKDAVGDLVIYLMDYCGSRGWDLQQIIEDTWSQVKLRDWTKNKQNGEASTKP